MFLRVILILGTEKRATKKHATCLTTLLQNELNSDVARYITHIKPVLQQIRLLTGLNVGGKTRNIASCKFLFPVLTKLLKGHTALLKYGMFISKVTNH